jgi:tetratricopeptide (TPR) repeat protein
MKIKLLLAVFVTLISATLFGQENEKQAILKSAQGEADAFYKRNLKEWQSYRIKDADASFTFVSKYSYINKKGWDSINSFITRIINNSKPSLYEFKQLNPIIRINGNLAWLEYDELSIKPATDTIGNNFQTHEQKIFLKENGKWKILSQIGTDSESWEPTPSDAENTLNSTGYQLLADKKINDAIEVFKLNIKLHPDSWNTYDSMGEAYAIAGNKELAIENYETSIKMNPKNESGKTMLAQLKNQ